MVPYYVHAPNGGYEDHECYGDYYSTGVQYVGCPSGFTSDCGNPNIEPCWCGDGIAYSVISQR